MEPSEVSRGHEWTIVNIVAIKDAQVRHTVVPMPLRRRRKGAALGADPICAYDALRAAWLAR
eukprot:630784-Pleurochrysis_carterae.AAC.1